MQVRVNPRPHEVPSGLTSFASWNNHEVKKAMNKLFGIQRDEKIVSISVDEQGIKAHIERR